MMNKKRILALAKEAGLDEKKFLTLLKKESNDPEATEHELENVSGGRNGDMISDIIYKRADC